MDDRRVLNDRSGAPWRDLAARYGPYTTCYNRFVRWRCAGVWDRILGGVSHCDDADVQIINSTIVLTGTRNASGAREEFGRTRGGTTTKIHAVVDANGLPLHIVLTAGQQHDSPTARAFLEVLSELWDGSCRYGVRRDLDANVRELTWGRGYHRDPAQPA